MSTRKTWNFIRHSSFVIRSCLFLVMVTGALGQTALQDMFYSVGTSTTNRSGQHWAYLVWDTAPAALAQGRHYAIYRKSGNAASLAPYERSAIVQRQTDPRIINALLNRASNLGESINELNEGITALFQTMTNALSLPLPDKVSAVIRGSFGNADFEGNLRLLAKGHPGLAMSLGLAHGEMIQGPAGASTTFEIREHDPVKGRDIGVVGRITVIAGMPVELPAPGAPVRVPEDNPRGHLNAKLRWATPDDLRRLSLLGYGFNVWRMTRAFSESRGIGANAPLAVTLHSLTNSDPSHVKRVNTRPVLKSRDFDFNSARDFSATGDRDTFFLADDNDRFSGGMPFQDGQEFYYYITARDILGRDGRVSPGTLAMMCSRLPPAAPTGVKVENDYSFDTKSKQVLRISWRQTENSPPGYIGTPRTNIIAYWVYRWTNHVEMTMHEADPLANRIAVVPYIEGTNTGFYVDDGTNSPSMPADASKTFWYTVRAQEGGVCTNNPSPHSAMAFGVLRDRVGPPPPSGGLVINCPTAIATYADQAQSSDPDAKLDTSQLLLQCTRQHAELAWAEFKVHIEPMPPILPNAVDFDLGRVEFAADGKALIDCYLPKLWDGARVTVSCRVGASDRIISAWTDTQFQTWPANGNRLALFYNGRIDISSATVDSPRPIQLSSLVFFTLPPFINDTYLVLYTPNVNAGIGLIQTSTDLSAWNDLTNASITTIFGFGPFFVLRNPSLADPMRFYRVLPASYSLPLPCDHFPFAGNNAGGSGGAITTRTALTPTSKEYRIYRRVDDGPLTLLAQGEGDYDKTNVIERIDEALPEGASRICYFAQLFDEHGNPSALTPLGDCVTPVRRPPCPVLSSIQPVYTNGQLMARLRWACPPEGVERFKIEVDLKAGTAPKTNTQALAGNALGALNGPSRIQASAAVNEMGRVIGPKVTYVGSYATDRVGGNIGGGPVFSTLIDVAGGTEYLIRVIAVGPGGAESKNCLPPRPFKSMAPPAEQPEDFPRVQWPERPLPPKSTNWPQVSVHLMPRSDGSAGIDPNYPVGIRIGALATGGSYTNAINCQFVPRFTGGPSPSPYSPQIPMGMNALSSIADPLDHLFAHPKTLNEKIFPMVLYRTQLPNETFPVVSGDLVQASPLMEKIAYNLDPPDAPISAVVRDPFVRVMRTVISEQPVFIGREYYPFGSNWLCDLFRIKTTTHEQLYLLDTQPVLAGATYHYMLVRFDPVTREVNQTISVGNVTIPEN